MPRALVIRTAGTNCDAEMCRGFALAGAEPQLVHLDRLIARPVLLDDADLVGFPGGFSYGDDIASGRIFAMKVRERLWPALHAAVQRGAPMIGACNGFQVMVQVGLLPGPVAGESWSAGGPPPQTIGLTDNRGGRFVDRWVGVRPEADSVCVWTRGLDRPVDENSPAPTAEVMMLPVAHGEGRLVAPGDLLRSLAAGGQIVLRYTDNYNGSAGSVAGVCDTSGRIFGLMPHPERYLDWNRHPFFTRLPAETRRGDTPGLRIFRNAVEAAVGATA
ncbi:MAG: phosphoribosylformylglycinamidine synthase subunit PurQ [Phycisphaerales bacterium]|nr:phosphoribosylformylglycinamidine synthase subunit PurQ [Phycisphaerales bacterium]